MKTSSIATARTAQASPRAVFKKYYYLTKPGIARGNLFTAAAGFLLASQGVINFWQFAAMAAGLALVIASGCVCNNYLDRGLDTKMARTSKRALVTGAIGDQRALVFAAILGISGITILALGCNLLATALGAFGFFAYVVIYGIAKRRSVHGTLIGSISGAVPPLVGYAAVSGRLDLAALLLFVVLVCWQMPHFYAIAIYRCNDYASAGLPVLPVVKGFAAAKFQMIVYAAAFVAATGSLALFGVASIWYGIAVTIAGSIWLLQNIRGLTLRTPDLTVHWARQVFGSSLVVLLVFCAALGADSFFA